MTHIYFSKFLFAFVEHFYYSSNCLSFFLPTFCLNAFLHNDTNFIKEIKKRSVKKVDIL